MWQASRPSTSLSTVRRGQGEPSRRLRPAWLLLLCATLVLATPAAAWSVCGDTALDPGEECDDGNRLDGDCCDSLCRFEPDDSPCDDGDICTDDACLAGVCVGSPACDDGADCTTDSCDSRDGSCSFVPDHLLCDDGLSCNGAEICETGFGCTAGAPLDCSGLDSGCEVGICDEGSGRCVTTTSDLPQCDAGSLLDTDGEDATEPQFEFAWEDDPGDGLLAVKGALRLSLTNHGADRPDVEVSVRAFGLDQRFATRVLKKRLRARPERSKRIRLPLRRVPVQSSSLWTNVVVEARWTREDGSVVVASSAPRSLRFDSRFRAAELTGAGAPAELVERDDLISAEAFSARLYALETSLVDPPGRVRDPEDPRQKMVDVSVLREREAGAAFVPGAAMFMQIQGDFSDQMFFGFPSYSPFGPANTFPVCGHWPASFVDSGGGEDHLASLGLQWVRAAHTAVRIMKVPESQFQLHELVYEGFLDGSGCVNLDLDQGQYTLLQYPLWDVSGFTISADYQGLPPSLVDPGDPEKTIPNPDYNRIDLKTAFGQSFIVGPPGSPLPPFANVYPSVEDHLTRISATVSHLTSMPDAGFAAIAQQFRGHIRRLTLPLDVVVSPDGGHAYVLAGSFDENLSTGALLAFERDAATGELSFMGVNFDGYQGFDEGLHSPKAFAMSPDGRNLYVVGYGHTVGVYTVEKLPPGRLSQLEMHHDGVAGVDGIYWPKGVEVSPDGKHVYVSSYSEGGFAIFSRNLLTGALSFVGTVTQGVGGADGLAGLTGFALSPDGNNLYATSSSGKSLAVYSRDAGTGALSFEEKHVYKTSGVKGLFDPQAVAVSPDGGSVYAVGSKEVSAFTRDPLTGLLSFVKVYKEGKLGVQGTDQAYAVVVSPDSANVYVKGALAIAAFTRDPVTGALSFLEAHTNGGGGVDGLDGTLGMAPALSPNGASLYALGSFDDAVATFSRNPSTGALSFLDAQRNHHVSDEVGFAQMFVHADQGCPDGFTATSGWYTAKYGGCAQGSTVFIGESPYNKGGHDSYWKYVIAHEIGHSIQHLLVGNAASDYNITDSISGLSAMCSCDHVVTANALHCFQGIEDIAIAFIEGWAQFYAARSFNDIGDGDCSFAYYKEYKTGPDPSDPVKSPPIWFDCQAPLELMANYCPPPLLPGVQVGNEADWMYFLWRAHEDASVGAGLEDLAYIMRATCDEYPPHSTTDWCDVAWDQSWDLIKTSELAPAAVQWFGAGPAATNVATAVTLSGIENP